MSLKKRYGKTARLAAVVTGLGWFLLYIGVLLNGLYAVGTNGQLFYRLQLRANVPATAPIETEELLRIDNALADYLNGNAEALSDSPFNADELAHMEDCYRLFRLLKTVMIMTVAAGAVLLMIGMGVLKYRKRTAGRIAALCMWLPIIIAAIWAAVDFYSLFSVFHRLLFTNDLWLMDPAKDLMIRICPESMFETMAAIVAAITLIYTLIAEFAVWIVFGRDRRRR